MPVPKIGMKQQPDPVPSTVAMSPEEIRAAEQERDALVAVERARAAAFERQQSPAVATPVATNPLTAMLNAAGSKLDADAARRRAEQDRERGMKTLAPLLARANDVVRDLRAMRGSHLVQATEAAATDVAALIRRLPVVNVSGTESNHMRLGLYQRVGEQLVSALSVNFDDLNRHRGVAELDVDKDPRSAAFVSAMKNVTREIVKLETNLAAAKTYAATLAKLAAAVEVDMATIGDRRVDAAPVEKITIPTLIPQPTQQQYESQGDWCPIEKRLVGASSRTKIDVNQPLHSGYVKPGVGDDVVSI